MERGVGWTKEVHDLHLTEACSLNTCAALILRVVDWGVLTINEIVDIETDAYY